MKLEIFRKRICIGIGGSSNWVKLEQSLEKYLKMCKVRVNRSKRMNYEDRERRKRLKCLKKK